jgi:predicted site-specific integrase-resolvase
MSMDRFCEQMGISAVTAWRWRERGWLKTIVIAGRRYITREAIADFNRRAVAGEFAGEIHNPSRHRKKPEP